MSVRLKTGRPRVVSAAQTVDEGRPSRARPPGGLGRRPALPGIEGAIAALVAALAEVAAGVEGAGNRLRHARRRLVALVGRQVAREVEARAQVDRPSLAAIAATHASARPRLFQAATDAVSTMAEHDVATTAGRSAVATAFRLRGLGAALLDAGARSLDAEALRAGAALIEAGRRELLFAFEVERRADTREPIEAIDVTSAVERATRGAIAAETPATNKEPTND